MHAVTCAGNTSCTPICPIQAKYNAGKTLALANRSKLKILAQAVASRINYDSTGGAIKITRSAVGIYRVTFDGLGAAGLGHKSNVQVTAYDARTTCNVQNWGGSPDFAVNVNCFYIPDGSLHDSKYTVLVTFSP